MSMVHPCPQIACSYRKCSLKACIGRLEFEHQNALMIVDIREVPNIMEFSKLVHMKNARDMASHMPLFFKNKLFCGPQRPQFSQLQDMICWDVQIKPV